MSFDAGVARPLPGCFLFNVVEEQQLKLNSNYHNKHAVARCLFQRLRVSTVIGPLFDPAA